VGTPQAARLEEVPFDAGAAEMAWEERPVIDADCFAAFGDRASRLLAPLESQPILRRWWPLAVERSRECHRLGLAIAQRLERSLEWDRTAQRFANDEEANRLLDRARRDPWTL
jgi:hypothetical protein